MRVVFAGTPEFALASLRALTNAGFDVPLVLTQPDRPAGRGLKLHASVVKTYALEHCIALAQPRSLRLDGKFSADAAAAREVLLAARPDVMVVAAYGLLLPPWVLELPRLGCVNVHASLLPRWRGAAPIHRAIEAGDAQTGITIMQMDVGLDTGGVLLARSVPVLPHDSTATLHDRLAELGAQMIVTVLQGLRVGELRAVPQGASGVTYAPKIDKAEAAIDWALPAEVIERRIRAFDPFPGASGELHGEALKCWHAELVHLAGSAGAVRALPGQVLAVEPAGVTVSCGSGALRITELQRSGGKRMAAGEFLTGHDVKPGMRFATAAH
jgi:methionyl-tRNA formyltransferase